jgi:hypothetical protein
VLAIGGDRRIRTPGPPCARTAAPRRYPNTWNRYCAGTAPRAGGSTTGPSSPGPNPDKGDGDGGPGHRWLLIRRHPGHGEPGCYRCYAPQPVPLREPVRIAGAQWGIAESFQAGKTLTGLDAHQVRRGTCWRRWTLVAMLAHALLAHAPRRPGLPR